MYEERIVWLNKRRSTALNCHGIGDHEDSKKEEQAGEQQRTRSRGRRRRRIKLNLDCLIETEVGEKFLL